MSDDIGGHTGKPVLNGKVPRRDSDGWELFTDYFTATEDSQTQSPSKRQDGGEEQPPALASPLCLDDSLVLDSLEGSWMEGDSRAGSPVIHPEDVSAGGRSAHLYFVELMRRHESNVDADLHVPGNEDFNSVAENISPTKTDIQAIIAVPDSSATGLSDVASEELEMATRESCAKSGAAQRDAQLERDDPLAFPLACFGTGEEKPDSLSPLRDRTQLYANFWRHPLFQTDEDISQLVRSSDTSEGNKWPKKTLTNISEVVVLNGPKIIWPHSDAGTSLTKPSCTEGELCKKFEWRELGAFRNSVSKSEPHKSPLRKKKLPLLLPAPKAEQQPTERETENSGGMPLISRDLWSSGACSKSTQDPSARFAQWANNLGQDSGLKSTSEGPSGSSLLDHMSSKTGHHAQEGDGASGAAAAKNPNSEGAHPAKGNSCHEAPKSPEEGSLWHTLRYRREMPEICFWPDVPLTTRENSALLIAPTELKQLPLQNQKASGEKTSFWSRPKSSALGSQSLGSARTESAPTELNQQSLQNQKASGEKTSFWSRPKSSALGSQSLGSSRTESAPTELNQQPVQNQKASGEKTSFWSRPKSSALGSKSSGSSHTAIAPTELNQQSLQNQKASGEKPSFWSRPKSSSLGSQVSEGSHTASPLTELNQHSLQNQVAFEEKTSFWSRPKSSALVSQVSEGSRTESAPTELNQQLSKNQKASGGKPSFWSRPKSSSLDSQSSEGSRTASAPTELNQQPLQNQKASGEKPSFWSRPKSSSFGSQSSEGSHTASAPTELNKQPLRNQKSSGENTSFWSRPKSSAFVSQVSEGSRTAGPPTELNQHPMQNQAVFGKKTSFWSRPKSSALGSQASETGHGVHQKSGVEPTATADFSCLYSSGQNGSDAGRNTLRNVPVDKSNGNTANSANMPAKRLWKRRPLLLPGPLKRPAACLEAAPSSALELLNPAQTMANKFPKSPRKDDAQMEAKDTAAKMRKCDTRCETKDTSTQTAGPKAEPHETSAQTSFICVLGKRMMLDETGKHHLRGTFHMKQEELKFIDMSLQRANENTPVSFASYLTTNSVTVGRLRLGSNQEKPPAANNHSDTVLIPQDHSVKVATIGQGWLLLTKGSSFFVRRGVPFSLKNVGTATAEILYVLSRPC